jgi:tetratricopeptide (TPR) repeat protein
MKRSLCSLTSIAALGLLVPAVAAGQARDMADEGGQRPMYQLPSLTVVLSEATPLHEEARALYEQGRWVEAARLYADAANAMPTNDAESYEAYDMAGRLYFYGRDYANARKSMERAAEVAEATGDIVSAAFRHVDAAFMAVWEGFPAVRREHVRKAQEHAASDEFGTENSQKLTALILGVEALPMQDADTED